MQHQELVLGSIPTVPHQDIINYLIKDLGLSHEQRHQLQQFSLIDDEWRCLMALGNRYPGSETRLSELDQLRAAMLNDQASSTLTPLLYQYLAQIDLARFENEP